MAKRSGPAPAQTVLARVRVTIDGKDVVVDDVNVGYNYEKKGLLLDLVIPLAARKVSAKNTKLAWRNGAVVLEADAARIAEAQDAAAQSKRVAALVDDVVEAFDIALGRARAPKLTVSDAPARLIAAVPTTREQIGELRLHLADVAIPVGEGVDIARFGKKHSDVRCRSVSFYVDDGSFAAAVAARLENAIGNHDNDESALAAAIAAYRAACSGIVDVADNDTLLLRPGRMASAPELRRIKKAFAGLNYEVDSGEVAAGVADDVAKLRPSFFWWD
jgi:hypothetical protein